MSRSAVAGLVLACLVGTAADGRGAQAGDAAPQRILVVPFENVTGDTASGWLGEAAAILVADHLNALGLSAITRSEREQAFERLQVPPAAVLTEATIIRIAQLVGATYVIVGTVGADGDALVVRGRTLALEEGRVEADATDRGTVSGLFDTFDRLAGRLAPGDLVPLSPPTGSGATLPAAAARERPPIEAFESFIRGVLEETPAAALRHLNAALARYPAYDRVRLALWETYAEQGDHARALAALQAVPAASAWARRARFYRGLSLLTLKRYDDAFATYKELEDQEVAPTVLNNLGIVQMRRGGDMKGGLPTDYFDRAARADPGDPDYFFNLGYASWQARDAGEAVRWLREAVRRNPADGEAHFVLGAALAATGNLAESQRETELAVRLSSTYEGWRKRPAGEQVPRGLERVKANEIELPHGRRVETKIQESGQREQAELAAFHLDRGRRLFAQENDREAAAELDRATYLSPYLAEAHLLLGRIHLRNGRLREAIDALKISLWSAATAEAHLALAEAYVEAKEPALARPEAERALALDPASIQARRLVDMLKSP